MRFKFHITAAISCIGLLVLNLPAFGHLSLDADDIALHTRTDMQAPGAGLQQPRAAYRVPPSVAQLVEAAKPATGWPALITEARKYLGTNPTDRKRLWCATFMNMVLTKLGYPGTNSDAARSFASYGQRISKPQVGAIAVLTRGPRGGHVGIVSGVDAQGNPVLISGNHNKRVGVGIYPRSRVITYVMPTRREALPRGAGYSPAGLPAPDRPFDSPISELLAAVDAKQAHAESRTPRRTAQRRVDTHRAEARRLVQQMPD